MYRPAFRASIALGLAVLGAGCQDYNFNPVGKCLIAPATERFTLSDVSSADVLFVVDESGSMVAEQNALATAFASFIANLNAYNTSRVAGGLQPFDFHIAVTTSSVMWNVGGSTPSTCRNDCAGNAGTLVCCSNGQPLKEPRRCTASGECNAGNTCRTDCNGLKGENYCCDAGGVAQVTQTVPCSKLDAACGELNTHYRFAPGCVAGVAVDEWPYAQGDFVSVGGNPRVLHFDKSLYEAGGTGRNRQGYTQAQLADFFAGATGSVKVGTCGSGQEQALLAAKLAVEKALAGQQKDTVDLAGNPTWNATTRTATSAAEWPRPGSKLVLVFVGDEDDCSSPTSAADGVVWLPQPAGADACVRDATLPESERRQFPVGELVNYFTGLGRPVGAAFVISTAQDACGRPGTPGACTPGICCGGCPGNTCTSTCGAQAPGFRLYDAALGLRSQGAEVFAGSICDSQFSLVLDEIANVVKPPGGLVLPTEPAEGVVTVLRIADTSGQTRKICKGPAPAGTPDPELDAWDWWFTVNRDGNPPTPVAVSKYVTINRAGACQANPGETYSADYIGVLPPGGCASRSDCRDTLGGRVEDWGCFVPPGASRGTCICCASGSTDPACQ